MVNPFFPILEPVHDPFPAAPDRTERRSGAQQWGGELGRAHAGVHDEISKY